MPFNPLVANAGRLRILTALAAEPGQAFVALRRATGLTDGNLATHARRLQSAGFLAIEKSITDGKPLTTLHLTADGRAALAAHARALLDVLEPKSAPDWALLEPASAASAGSAGSAGNAANAVAIGAADDWVD